MKRIFESRFNYWAWSGLLLVVFYIFLYYLVISNLLAPSVSKRAFLLLSLALIFLLFLIFTLFVPVIKGYVKGYRKLLIADDHLVVDKETLAFSSIARIAVNEKIKTGFYFGVWMDAAVLELKDGRVVNFGVHFYENDELLRYNLKLLKTYLDGDSEVYRPVLELPEDEKIEFQAGKNVKVYRRGFFQSFDNWQFGFFLVAGLILTGSFLFQNNWIGTAVFGVFTTIFFLMLVRVNRYFLLSEDYLVVKSVFLKRKQKVYRLEDIVKAERIKHGRSFVLQITDSKLRVKKYPSALVSFKGLEELAKDINGLVQKKKIAPEQK